MTDIDPMTDLVRQAMGYGVMLATEGKDRLVAKLQAQGPSGSLPDALIEDAESFLGIRTDLVEAVVRELEEKQP